MTVLYIMLDSSGLTGLVSHSDVTLNRYEQVMDLETKNKTFTVENWELETGNWGKKSSILDKKAEVS